MQFKIFVGSEQIEGKPVAAERMKNAVARFEKKSTFLFLSMLNNYLCLGSGALPDESQNHNIARTILAALFDNETMHAIRAKGSELERQGHSIVILHRWQILGLMKMLILWAPDSGLNPNSSAGARFEIGKLCLMATSFLSPEPGGVTKDEIRAQLLPTFELSNPPELFNAIARTYSYLRIAGQVPLIGLEPRKVNDLFEDKYGISIFKYISLVYSVYSTYEVLKSDPVRYFNQPEKLNISRSSYFSNLTFSEGDLYTLFDLTSIAFDELLKSGRLGASLQFDFLDFRKYPLIKISNDLYTCIDLEFLAEKLNVTNWFLAVRDSLPNDHSKSDQRDAKTFSSLNDTWGKDIFERYVGGILESCRPMDTTDSRKRNHKIIPQSSNSKDASLPQFDWGVFNANSLLCRHEPSWLIWLECKTVRIDLNSKYGNNPERLTKKLLDIFKLYDGKNQILRGVKTVIDGSAIGLSRLASIIYPVIIIEDELFGFEPMADLITEAFEKERDALYIPNTLKVKPLTILTIETLENIERYWAAGYFTLQEFLEFRSTTTSSDFAGILSDFIKLKASGLRPPNRRLDLLFHEFHEKFKKYFHPEAFERC